MLTPYIQSDTCNKLNNIIQNMILTMESSKKEVFEFVDASRNEYELVKVELNAVRNRLEMMGKQFNYASISDSSATMTEVAKIYSKENNYLIDEKGYDVHKDRKFFDEERIIAKQCELENRLVSLISQIDEAEVLATQINVILNYLTSDFQNIGELSKDARQKQELGFRIIEAQEEERKHLSREIHDGTAQTLAHLLMRSDLLERVGRKEGLETLLDEIRVMREHIRNALDEVRRVIYDLRPMALDDLGLIPTLKKYLKTIKEYNDIDVIFVYHDKKERIPANYEIACFRLIQEAVQNVCKHANATTIEVNVELMREKIVFSIRDNGSGFNVKDRQEGSFGILGMKERVDLLNGKVNFHSELGKGTYVLISIPLTNNV